MNCALQTTIVGLANLTLGSFLGYYLSNKQQRISARRNFLLKLKDILISKKVRLLNEVPNKPIMGDVSDVQGVFESLKSIIKKTDVIRLNIAWQDYYKSDHNRNPFDSPGKKDESIKAIDCIINLIEENL